MSKMPIIFISYSHKDEPDPACQNEDTWLTYVQSFLQPALKDSVFEIWTDENIPGGAQWEKHIQAKLAVCDICILLVSRHSLNSKYCIKIEVEAIRRRQEHEDVQIYPILLTPVPEAALKPISHLNLRPKNKKALSGFPNYARDKAMSDIADEIVDLLGKKSTPQRRPPTQPLRPPSFVHITGLPETAYERLVGREAELKRLDDAWADRKTNILSLVAEGGAGKSALVNEWLKRLQADNYRGAEAVLGWSFYSQGSKERATSAEPFLNWALDKLGIKIETTSASAKGEAIAEPLARRRVLLVLDGVEPLQHGLDKQQGELKDLGLRALLRGFASTPPGNAHGLTVITSRLPVKDIARWRDDATPVIDVEQLADEAGAALLRDNGVWGTDMELQAAARAFGGHPLALGLLASFLKEKHFGDVRRRDHICAFFADSENPGHDHARRVMESYEKEWLAGQPVHQAIMYMAGLFDRPASGNCLRALRQKPAIPGLTDAIVDLDEDSWRRAVARLREVRLLAPPDPSALDALDAHPLVREWFGERLMHINGNAWCAAHGRIYEHLRDTTDEGKTPTLENFAPLYQAIAHGCRAGRQQEALDDIYADRICRRLPNRRFEFYASRKLGAQGSNLAAISWFFEKAYEIPIATLTPGDRAWVLGQAAVGLRAQGRFAEALPAERASLRMDTEEKNWINAAICASNLSDNELVVGEVAAALATAEQSVAYGDQSGEEHQMWSTRAFHAAALHVAGRREEAESLFVDAEERLKKTKPRYPLLYANAGYRYCDLLIEKHGWSDARHRAGQTLELAMSNGWLLFIALDTLVLGRTHLGLALEKATSRPLTPGASEEAQAAHDRLGDAVEALRAAAQSAEVSCGLLARSAFYRSVGDWEGATRDLDEVEEIAEPGPMRLRLCDMALERTRLALARIEAFAPLNGLAKDSPPKPELLSEVESKSLQDEAAKQFAIAANYITTCGYHRRDEELVELQGVLRSERTFASLPPRV